MSLWKPSDNWLKGIAEADHPQHTIYPIDHLSVGAIQESFDKTYGKGRFNVVPHGTCIVVFSYGAMVQKLKNSREKMLARGNLDEKVAWYDDKIAYYEGKAE